MAQIRQSVHLMKNGVTFTEQVCLCCSIWIQRHLCRQATLWSTEQHSQQTLQPLHSFIHCNTHDTIQRVRYDRRV